MIYLILSCLLLGLGTCLYFVFLQKRLNPVQAKRALTLIIILSVSIPMLVPNLPQYTQVLTEGNPFYYENYDAWNVVNIEDKQLQQCYEKALNSEDICGCEVVQQANIITFEQDPFYNFIASAKTPVFIFLLLLGGVFLIELLIKVGCLIYLVKTGYLIRQEVQGTVYYLLYPNVKAELPVSSFTLFKHYIIWSPMLDQLSAEEREAVILHEVAHLRQRDTYQQILLQLVKLGWWMLPFFYLIRRELNKLNEYVADLLASEHMGNRKQYAALLLKVKEQQNASSGLSYAMAFAQSLLRKRVLFLIRPEGRTLKPLQFRLSMFAMLLVFWVTTAFALTEFQKQDIRLQQYQHLKSQSVKTGQHSFCKSCLKSNLESTTPKQK